VTINSCGYQTWTTKDRLNKYMPYGFRAFAVQGDWFISTRFGVVPFGDACNWTEAGRTDLPEELNREDAVRLKNDVHQYALKYIANLVCGKLHQQTNYGPLFGEPEGCQECIKLTKFAPLHLLRHIKEGDMSLSIGRIFVGARFIDACAPAALARVKTERRALRHFWEKSEDKMVERIENKLAGRGDLVLHLPGLPSERRAFVRASLEKDIYNAIYP
jgi:hypothetical protein